jgi:N-acetylglucosaminyldiphosphoundecaprenol N-acetyl-beta-D-mannosaminyltransferase
MQLSSEDTVNILSVNVSRLNLEDTVQLFQEWIHSGKKKRVCVTPVNCVLWAYQDEKLRLLYNSSDMNLADGVPLVWASRFLRMPIKGRVTGLDLLPRFAEIGNREKFKFFFLGAKEGVAEHLVQHLALQFPQLEIVGHYSPPFAERFSNEENAKMISLINSTRPHVLWVSLTAPKQDFWINEHFDKLDVNIAIGVGGAFEVTSGLIKRAPVWMQKSGLEWFYRFVQEPRRLFKRYFVEAPQFIPLVLLQKFKLLETKGVKNK